MTQFRFITSKNSFLFGIIKMNSISKSLVNVLFNPNKPNIQTIYRNCAYKSSISLENLYPKSGLKLVTPELPIGTGDKFSGYIPMNELVITYSRSSGPGGQNVNKVNTKVDLRFHLESATWLSEDVKRKIGEKLQSRISSDGFLIFRSEVTRSQQLNLADCLNKLRTAIRAAEQKETAPTPETMERIRRRNEKAAKERLLIKRERSMIKEGRQPPDMRNLL